MLSAYGFSQFDHDLSIRKMLDLALAQRDAQFSDHFVCEIDARS